jgi:hypothetical protein
MAIIKRKMQESGLENSIIFKFFLYQYWIFVKKTFGVELLAIEVASDNAAQKNGKSVFFINWSWN